MDQRIEKRAYEIWEQTQNPDEKTNYYQALMIFSQ